MRFPTIFTVLWHVVLLTLLLFSVVLVSPSSISHVPCLLQDTTTRKNDNFSSRAIVDRAQNAAYLSPSVFLGTLRSVLVQRDGTVRAWFAMDSPLKMNSSAFSKSSKVDQEVVYFRSGACAPVLNQDNLRLGSQYLVFGAPWQEARPYSLAATALPIPNEKRTLRAVKRIVCKGCAKAPSIAGLKSVRVVEGGKTRLHCHLAGNPIPWVEWYKDGKKITATRGRLRVRTKRRTSRLVVRKARASDRGTYECRAGNVVQLDSVSSTATLIVTRRPRITTPRPRPTHTPTVTSTASSLWTIEPCPNSDFCLNGGTCAFYKDVREYVCHCAEGFVGLRCHYKDVNVSLGGVKNVERNPDRLFITIVVLFVILFCFNWAVLGICWLYCFRRQQSSSWGDFQQMAPLRKLFNWKLKNRSSSLKVVEVQQELNPDCSDESLTHRSENEVETANQNEEFSFEVSSTAVK